MKQIALSILFIASFISSRSQSRSNEGSLFIAGHISNALLSDTMNFYIFKKILSAENLGRVLSDERFVRIIRVPLDKGTFQLRVDSIESFCYVVFNKEPTTTTVEVPIFIWPLLAKSGDSIYLSIDGMEPIIQKYPGGASSFQGYTYKNIQISGRGAEKYKYQIQFYKELQREPMLINQFVAKVNMHEDSLMGRTSLFDSVYYSTFPRKFDRALMFYNQKLNEQLSFLKEQKKKIEPSIYKILFANLISHFEFEKGETYYSYKGILNKAPLSNKIKTDLLTQISSAFESSRVQLRSFNTEILQSPGLVYSTNRLAILEYGTDSAYFYLKKSYEGQVRDLLICDFVFGNWQYSKNKEKLLRDALSVLDTDYYRDIIENKCQAAIVGKSAIEFSLPNEKGEQISLNSMKGKTVFVDFWYTGCAGCMSFYIRTLQKVEEMLKADTTFVFVSISIDKDPAVWRKSLSINKYSDRNAENVVNLYTEGKGHDHPLIKEYLITGYPFQLIIDKNGKIFSTAPLLKTQPSRLVELLKEANNVSD